MQGGGVAGGSWIRWPVTPPPLRRVWRSKVGKVEKIVKVMAKIKAKCSGQLPYYNSILWHLHVFCAATIFN